MTDGDPHPSGLEGTGEGTRPVGSRRRVRLRHPALVALPYLAAVLGTVWVFRPIFDSQLPGNIGDARWTIAIHDHWYRVWQGDVSVRDLRSFFPVAGTLGTSDAFVAQGQFYSAARLLGWGMIDAWVISQFVTYLIGAVGLAALSQRALTTPWARTAFVVLCCAAYPVYLQTGHPQLFAIFWPAWIVWALLDLHDGRKTWSSALVLAAVPPMLALSSWYVLVLFLALGCVFAVVRALCSSNHELRRAWGRAAAAIAALRPRPTVVVPAVIAIVGWASVAWVYLAGRGILAPPVWDDVVPFSPQWSDLLNASGGGGGVWRPLYEKWFLDGPSFSAERAAGFGLVLLISMIVALVVTARAAVRPSSGSTATRAEWRTLFALLLTCLVTPLIFITDERGFSLFKPLWLSVPGLESIRAPFRIQGLVYATALFAVVRVVEIGILRRRSAGQTSNRSWRPILLWVGAGALISSLFVEMHRPPHADWVAAEVLPAQLRQHVDEIADNCDALIVVDEIPGGPIWLTPIDAVMLSVMTGVPTPQGYGRGVPVGHPGFSATPPALDAWMRSLGFDGRSCAVSSDGVERIDDASTPIGER
jgi:hypothetical protein